MSYRDVKNIQSILFCLLVFVSGYVGAAGDPSSEPERSSSLPSIPASTLLQNSSRLGMGGLLGKPHKSALPQWIGPVVIGMGMLALLKYKKGREAAERKKDELEEEEELDPFGLRPLNHR